MDWEEIKMEKNLDELMVREPSLSEMSFEKLRDVAEERRKAPVRIHTKNYSGFKKAVIKTAAAVTVAGLIAVTSMYYGAARHKEIFDIQDKIVTYAKIGYQMIAPDGGN